MMGTRLRIAYQALAEMSDFTMDILKDRAERRGIKEVETFIREGNVGKELRKIAIETQATTLIIGQTVPSPAQISSRAMNLSNFAKELAEAGDVEVVVVGDETM